MACDLTIGNVSLADSHNITPADAVINQPQPAPSGEMTRQDAASAVVTESDIRDIEQELDMGSSSLASSGLQAYSKTSTVK